MRHLFILNVLTLFTTTIFPLSVKLEPAQRMVKLEKELLKVYLPEARNVLGKKLLFEARPWKFVVSKTFYKEVSKILNFINILEENKEEKICVDCLDRVIGLFWLQFRLFIVNLKNIDEREKEYLLDNLHKIYNYKNKSKIDWCEGQELGDREVEYDYKSRPLGLLFTKAVLDVFRVRSEKWTYEEKHDFLSQSLEDTKVDLLKAIYFENKNLESSFDIPLEPERVSEFVDKLKAVVLVKPMPFPWLTISRWLLITAAVAGGVIGVKYLASSWQKISENVKEGAQGFGSSAGDKVNDAFKNAGLNVFENGLEVKLPAGIDQLAAVLAQQLQRDGEGSWSRLARVIADKLADPEEGNWSRLAKVIADKLADPEEGNWSRFAKVIADKLEAGALTLNLPHFWWRSPPSHE